MENNTNSGAVVEGGTGSVFSTAVVAWGIVAIVFSIVLCTLNSSPMVLNAGGFAKFFAVILGSVLGLFGALIGGGLRKFAQPDSFYTSGGFFSIIGIKLFWICGPQIIGLVIGSVLGAVFVLR